MTLVISRRALFTGRASVVCGCVSFVRAVIDRLRVRYFVGAIGRRAMPRATNTKHTLGKRYIATATHHGTPHAHTAHMTAAAVPITGIQQTAIANATATSRCGLSESFMKAKYIGTASHKEMSIQPTTNRMRLPRTERRSIG
jgi:hypothetical protein